MCAGLPRAAGLLASAIFMVATLAYGVVRGDHVPAVAAMWQDARDWAANIAGVHIGSVALSGNHHLTREEVLAIAGITGRTSLLFLDVEQARERLKENPWIADATLLKLYPRELQISIKERAAFALWQKNGAVRVIADDGTVLEPYVSPRLVALPLVVGEGADKRAKEHLGLLDSHPALRDLVRASILVGERRWNSATEERAQCDCPKPAPPPRWSGWLRSIGKNLLARDIVILDLRLLDRITVRLTEPQPAARIEALKDKPKKKANDA
jgi:cell division protein FtsQ